MDVSQTPLPQLQHRGGRGSDGQSQAQAQAQAQAQVQAQAPANRQSSVAQGQACERCRQQKLRCSRESLKCSRCHRAAAVCNYPPPPDRKRLAAQRIRKSRFRSYQESRSPAAAPVQDAQLNISLSSAAAVRPSPSAGEPVESNDGLAVPIADDSHRHRIWVAPASPPSSHLAATPATPASRPTPAPSPEVARLLIEMYFTRAYNASLLFHKETFLLDYAANKLPNFVTNAIFALASIFLPPPSEGSRIGDCGTELGISALSTSDFGECAREWATVATQHVLMQAIEPNVQTIQACQVLALYWFSKDGGDRAHILNRKEYLGKIEDLAHGTLDLAYTSCRLLGFHVHNVEITEGDELLVELKRRCLWSCWMMACISQENAPFKSDCWSEVVGLPFPADEASFAGGRPKLKEAFNEFGRVVPCNASNESRQTSIMGELVKLLSLWWQTQRFVRRYQDGYSNPNDTSERLQEFLRLDRRLEMITENLHQDFKYSGPSSFTSPKLDPYILFSLQSLYRLCACTLHSSFVPLFSSTPADPEISKNLVRMCAEQVVKHSVIALDMATAFLSTRPDKSRLSSMTGFAIFVTSLIQIRSLGAQGKLKTHAGHLKAAVCILKELNQYWIPLRGLWTKLWLISSFAGLDINSFAVNGNDPLMNPAGIQTNIEQIVSSEALPESSSGVGLYTYVEQREPRVTSQQLSPADSALRNATTQALNLPSAGSKDTLESQISQKRRAAVVQANPRLGAPGGIATTASPSSLVPVYTQGPDLVPSKRPLQGGFDQHFGTLNGDIAGPAETMQLQMMANNPTSELYESSINPQTMSLDQGGTFRPMMDGFDTMNSMMGINLDVTNDDEFWWTQPWGSVRFL